MTATEEFKVEGMVALSGWRLHDLRRTCATIMQEDLGVPPHVIGAILNHSPQATMGVTSVYATGNMVDDRRRALNAWGQKLQSILDPDSSDNVLPLKKTEK